FGPAAGALARGRLPDSQSYSSQFTRVHRPRRGRRGSPMKPNFDAREVHALFEALFEGTLTPDKAQELDALLVGDPQVRLRYVEYVQLQAGLANVAEDSLAPRASNGQAPWILHDSPPAITSLNGEASHVA